ncbi:MAG: hypothetical protein L0177_04655 [Chloroflexi bacterium]|nr:hypothetical protein [Chloroflexota bacterium]
MLITEGEFVVKNLAPMHRGAGRGKRRAARAASASKGQCRRGGAALARNHCKGGPIRASAVSARPCV